MAQIFGGFPHIMKKSKTVAKVLANLDLSKFGSSSEVLGAGGCTSSLDSPISMRIGGRT
jgi:hypothetical protein